MLRCDTSGVSGAVRLKSLPWSLVSLVLILASPALAAPPPPISALAYRPDGKMLAAGTRGEVALLDAANGNMIGRLPGQTGKVTAVAFSRDSAWLAVAGGAPGKAGEVHIYRVPKEGTAPASAEKTIAAHADLIHDLTFSPDGKMLATCGYDRLIKLWDVASGKEIRTLKDHSDSVYGVSFRPDGKLLASAAADRAVKIWDVATGVRLYSLGDPTDWVYAVAWSPDGKHLAAAGVDKSLRVWEADEREGKLVQTAFAHEKPVLRLAYSGEGKTLYSLSEDRTVKAWDTAKLAEKKVFAAQPETVLSFALRPDGKQLALGRYDGALELLDVESGKVLSQPLPEKPQPPKIAKVTPDAMPRGKSANIVIEGEHLAAASEVISGQPGVKTTIGERTANRITANISVAADVEPGAVPLRLKSPAGESAPFNITVDRFPARPEPPGTESPRTAQVIEPQTTLVGKLSRAGEVDYYRVRLMAGQELGVQAQKPAGSKLEPVLALEDPAGNLLAETSNGALGYRTVRAGDFLLAIHDREYRGGADFSYRLHIGEVPVVTSIFPLGLQRGTEAEIRTEGVHLSGPKSEKVKAAPDAALGSRVPLNIKTSLGTPLGNLNVTVGEFPESLAGQSLQVPGTANGTIEKPGVTQTWHFSAKKGQPLNVEVEARRLGSPLDSVIEILDVDGKPVERAVLRSIAKTIVTFRDHDSAGSGIRMDTWNEFAMDDYVLVGNELMRIRDLPRNPDDDCQFYAINGQRVGYLGTTPSHHAQGTPMFKVSINPPGATFPSNGMPVIALPYRNDDGGPGYGKDSRLRFEPPADGEYQVRIGDARGFGGPDYAYRLTVRPPRSDFKVRFNPTAPAVWRGGALPITVTADRLDDFDDRINVKLENLPPGFSAPATFIEAGQTSTTLALYADAKAGEVSAKHAPLKLVASADIDGKVIMREATGGMPKLVEPGDIVTTTAQSTVTIHPGQETRLLVHVDRRNGFKGRIPVDVLGLPHGVRVLHVGLNGILVTERDTSREIFIYAEPWVQPMERPFVVLARREGKNSEHAAKSVLLKVERPQPAN
jgi:hypothetical protein